MKKLYRSKNVYETTTEKMGGSLAKHGCQQYTRKKEDRRIKKTTYE